MVVVGVVRSGTGAWALTASQTVSCAFGLKRGQALLAHEPGADPYVEMHSVLDDLAFGNALEEQSRAHT